MKMSTSQIQNILSIENMKFSLETSKSYSQTEGRMRVQSNVSTPNFEQDFNYEN